ncbi:MULTISPECIES: hypothetical protein [unclassified Streptomyces]|uniref:hypothetical protein n=1 Tax=unclassified Streptomyces TaxID=2593676 RepID=UPI00344D954E
MRINAKHPAVGGGAAAAVAVTGLGAAVLLAAQHSTASTAVPPWALSAISAVGAVVPLLTVLVLRKASPQATLAAFPMAAACHAAALGGAAAGTPLKYLLVPSIAVSLLMCVQATLLRAEESDNRSRNRF